MGKIAKISDYMIYIKVITTDFLIKNEMVNFIIILTIENFEMCRFSIISSCSQ